MCRRKNKKQVAGKKQPCIWCTKGHFSLATCLLFFLGCVACLSQCKLERNVSVPHALSPPDASIMIIL